jgi:predicted peptidase
MALIQDYVAKNPDIDPNRIYIGGASNGGSMTMSMIMTYPDYFAAAYPASEGYADVFISDEQIEAIKDLPIWFTHAAGDKTNTPDTCTLATYNRLIAAGAA